MIVYVATAPYHGYCMKGNFENSVLPKNLLQAGKKTHFIWEVKDLLLD